MLNEKDLVPILRTLLPPISINDIHWRSEDSTNKSLLFYKIKEDKMSWELFPERIKSAEFAWMILNKDHPLRPSKSLVIPEDVWPGIQKSLLDKLYPLPDIKLIAVTGTNGKTTTAEFVLQLGEMIGKKGISIGTLGVKEKNKTLLKFGLTSPPLIDLRKYLYQFGKNKDFCVLEASSHALVQSRFFGLSFDQAGWTSFSQDHLDYHKTMEAYFKSKLLLFNHLKERALVFVPFAQRDLFNKISRHKNNVKISRQLKVELPLFLKTSFNRSNLEVAIEVLENTFGLNIPNSFNHLIPPEGRFLVKEYRESFIIIDFAHTPDALDNVCCGVKESFPDYDLKILFGCGGNRDKGKRSQMGKVAQKWGKKIYVTSDNPRSENPAHIIRDILSEMSTQNVVKILDRKEAVNLALGELQNKEVLLLAGKGHENYILQNEVKYPYSDIEEVEKFLNRQNV